jgi:hypothetical protein
MDIAQGLTAETLEPRALVVLRTAKTSLGIDAPEEDILAVASACYRLRPANGQPMTDLSAVAEALDFFRVPGDIGAWVSGMVKCTDRQTARAREVWTMMGRAPVWAGTDYDDEENA